MKVRQKTMKSSRKLATKPHDCDARSTWSNAPEEFLQYGSFPSKCEDNNLQTGSCLDTAGTVYRSLEGEAAPVCTEATVSQLDHGLWLLCGNAIRNSRWRGLHNEPRHVISNVRFNLNYSQAIKRTFDILGSLFLLAALQPFFVLIAILI